MSVRVRKTVHMDTGTDIELFESPDLTGRFLFVGLDGEQSVQKEGGYTRTISRSHLGSCCLHKQT